MFAHQSQAMSFAKEVHMNVKIDELMTKQVMTTTPSQRIGHVKSVMNDNGIHAMPVVNPEGEPIGIVSTSDFLNHYSDAAPIRSLMSKKVYTVNAYDGPHIAARVMRNHHLHRVVVTHEKKVVGILSSFDLLCLVEDRRYTAKNAPTKSKSRRGQQED